MTAMITSLEELNSTCAQAEERIGKYEDRAAEILQSEQYMGKGDKDT